MSSDFEKKMLTAPMLHLVLDWQKKDKTVLEKVFFYFVAFIFVPDHGGGRPKQITHVSCTHTWFIYNLNRV